MNNLLRAALPARAVSPTARGSSLPFVVPRTTELDVARAVLRDRFAGRPIVLGGARQIGAEWRIAWQYERLDVGNCCRPSLAIISTERSDAVGSGEGGIRGEGVARRSLRPSF